jgi:RNase P subunit RPR2
MCSTSPGQDIAVVCIQQHIKDSCSDCRASAGPKMQTRSQRRDHTFEIVRLICGQCGVVKQLQDQRGLHKLGQGIKASLREGACNTWRTVSF